MAYVIEECIIEGDEVVDGEEAGIDALSFRVELPYRGKLVTFHASMLASDDVQDASESDFPEFDCTMTIEQFKRLAKMFLRFDEQISTSATWPKV